MVLSPWGLPETFKAEYPLGSFLEGAPDLLAGRKVHRESTDMTLSSHYDGELMSHH